MKEINEYLLEIFITSENDFNHFIRTQGKTLIVNINSNN